jgi:hypothetical protein
MPCVDTPSDRATDEAWARLSEERAKLDAHIDELLLMRAEMDRLIERNRAHRAGDIAERPASASHSQRPALAPAIQWDDCGADGPKAPAEATTPIT